MIIDENDIIMVMVSITPQALAKAADAVGSGGKSPVSALNELGLKVLYSMTRQDGPAHCPNFTVSVTVSVTVARRR